jgi:hypothetical protein
MRVTEKYDTTTRMMSPEDTGKADYVAILLDTHRSHLDYRSWKKRSLHVCVINADIRYMDHRVPHEEVLYRELLLTLKMMTCSHVTAGKERRTKSTSSETLRHQN